MAVQALSVGSFGAQVVELQNQLTQLGFAVPAAEIDRQFFGPATRKAVIQLQQARGLSATGVADSATLAAMQAGLDAVAPASSDATSVATGVDVEWLQRVLSAQGFSIERGEIERSEFGPTTLAALHLLQYQRGLPAADDIDRDTIAALLEIEQNITININEDGAAPAPPAPKLRGTVQGHLVDEDGAPVAETLVSLFAKHLRSETHLRDAITDRQGQYRLAYDRPSAQNLVVRAYNAAGNIIAESATVFAAAASVQIDFTTGAGGIVRSPSIFTSLETQVAALLDGAPLEDLKENQDTHELQFLASAIGAPFNRVAYLYIAHVLGITKRLQDTTLFGIFCQGIPASLNAALAGLPDAGINDAFTAQVLNAVLAHSRASLAQALTAAVSANVLPSSYAAVQDSELMRLDALRMQSVGSAPYIRGKTPLTDLLDAGSVVSAVQTAFTTAFADNGGRLGPTWKALRANPNLAAPELATLNTTLQLGELLTGNLVLVKDTLQRLSAKTLGSVQNLALLDQSDWVVRITALDPQAASIPSVLPDDTAQLRIARFAKALAERFAARYPTTAFVGGLTRAQNSSFQTRADFLTFLTANPTLNFKNTHIDQFIATNKLSITQEALTEFKTAQRLFRISPHYATVEALHAAGYRSAQSVYFKGRAPFLAEMTASMGSTSLAKMAYARAQMTYATALMAFGRYNQAINGIGVAAMQPQAPDPSVIANLPGLQALFGSLDYFQCEDCQSVYSPAAYLVDLLQYLVQFPVTAGGVTNARDALLLRRPDIQYIALTCNNTNVTPPVIDLVNEIFEAAIAPPATPVTVIDTTGTSAERRALPQKISQAAYTATASALFPLSLPFDLPFAQTTAYIAALGTTWSAILTLLVFPQTSAGASAATIACAKLGINPEMRAIINSPDTTDPWSRWGLSQNPASVIDPKSGTPYPTPPGGWGWVAALNHVPVLLNRTGLSLQQLYQLLEAIWVTQSGVTLQPGTTTSAGVQILSSDTDLMVFTGLTDLVLDRANRFLRLWTATGLGMWELDWALQHPTAKGANLDDFLVFLSDAMAVAAQLNLPLQEVLSFWMTLETRDVTNHLGLEDTVVPSTYSEVFRNPAVLASWSAVFLPLGAWTGGGGVTGVLSGNPIIPSSASLTMTAASNASPISITTTLPHGFQTGAQVSISGVLGNTAANGTFLLTVTSPTSFTLDGSSGNGAWTGGGIATGPLTVAAINSFAAPTPEQLAISAALTLSASDITAILLLPGVANALSLDTLSVLLRYERLASSISLDISDLILWIQLTAGSPFNAPADTLEFLRRLAVLQGTGIAVHDLDYLLRNQSATQSSLAFTATQATTLLQTISNALAKLPAPTGGAITVPTYDPETIQTILVNALATTTGVTADVVTPVLVKSGVLPLESSTISLLSAQTSGVDPTQFPTLISAVTSVAKAAALFSALNPSETEFAFVVENAGTFGWLDPSNLPLASTDTSSYDQFEALIRALKLDRRQRARAPKLFDVLGQWLANSLPADVPTAIAGTRISVASASNTAPIAITTVTPHGLPNGAQVSISGVLGNTAANGTFTITVTSLTSFTLNSSGGNGAWTGGGAVIADATSLALALNASVSDVTAIAAALNATVPSLTLSTQPGSLADMAMLTSIANALDAVSRYRISGTTLVNLAMTPAIPDTASAAMGALQAQYPQSAWFAAIQPVEDMLRQNRRDALVAYLLGPGPATPSLWPLHTTDDIFNYYLIDPEMSSCALTTRLLQASLSIQQFVQQCFFNLFPQQVVDMSNTQLTEEWSWRQQYRLWQANREVFLYPENYLLPELRKNASPFFADLENELRQSNCDADAAEAAFENYLRKLVGVSRLVVSAHYNQTNPDGSTVLHVFAHTRGTPPQWYYRTRTSVAPNSATPFQTGLWSAWESLNLDIPSAQLVPVIWDQRLHLVWPVFKQISEKHSDQQVQVPGGSGGPVTSPAPQKFWAVEFAMSELSAGQWQAKKTITEKMYFSTSDSPLAFTFLAKQDTSFNLYISVYFTGTMAWTTDRGMPTQSSVTSVLVQGQVANAMLSMPEAPLQVAEGWAYLPPSKLVDLSQEPTYALIPQGAPFGGWVSSPTGYGFSGQDLVWGNYTTANSGPTVLNVLCTTTSTGQPSSIELLGNITNPRIIIPQQEGNFDSEDPFFVEGARTATDPLRTYLVLPQFYTISSSPQELDSLAYVRQWSTKYVFQTFYHPYARTLLRELEIGGVSQLMSRNLQLNPQTVRGWKPTFDFNALYNPNSSYVAQPYPGALGAPDVGESALDFDPASGGAYSLYNWEIFYHVPMFVASLLMQNQNFQDAMTWLEYIFNPSDSSGGPVPQRFWEMAPFNGMNSTAWTNQEIQNLLTTLASDTQQGISDPSTVNAINIMMNDPFDPHAIASTRIAAYGKATVMKFLDNVIAWADSFYSRYTAEMVSQAEQLYIIGDMILGPKPEMLRLPNSNAGGATSETYASLQNIDAFSNVLVDIENVVVAPEPPQSVVQGTAQTPSLPQFPGGSGTLLFCIPPNDQLLAYWDKISQRLYNIRHCLNIQGVAQPLPMYAPPLNPLLLAEAQAGGGSLSGTAPPAPIYRFATYLQKAVELTNDVRAYGALILSALEKQDAEKLAVLRANQELDIQTRMLDVKQNQVTEAQDQITALQNQKAAVQIRYNFYSTIAFMNPWEITAISLQGGALIANAAAVVLDMTSGVAHLIPKFEIGVTGFGGSPTTTVHYGGENVGKSATSWSNVSRGLAGILSEAGGMAATIGGYQRRMDEWNLQAQLAQAELTQMDSQITAATDRLNIANSELSIQNEQIANAQTLSDFLTSKYTKAQLYNWMVTQLTTVYAQAYQLAFALAQQAQNTYQYELGSQDTFLQFGYWDSQHSGLGAGESLLFDLRRMEAQYLAGNTRERELTKPVSLALTNPVALVMLRETGTCQITLDEALFERDHPGQYFRRLRSVALTVPCVTGPYTGVNATLSLTNALIRTQAPGSSYQPQSSAPGAPFQANVIPSQTAAIGTATIATSSGQNDSGLFDTNLHDERWLPFEGQGAISAWNLVLDPRDNNFDFSTITDVVLHIRYTARGGGDQTAANTVRTALKQQLKQQGGSILVSVKHTFVNAYYSFFNPTDTTATQQTLTLPITRTLFPYSNLGKPGISDITIYIVPTQSVLDTQPDPLNGVSIPLTVSLLPSGVVSSLPPFAFNQVVQGSTNAGGPIEVLTSGQISLTGANDLQSFVLTVPQATSPLGVTTNGSSMLDPTKIEDILLIINYTVD